tara:strand:- start:2069 stop:2335 length:267 start_codon:yes stop_codon:yes gene_type:complete
VPDVGVPAWVDGDVGWRRVGCDISPRALLPATDAEASGTGVCKTHGDDTKSIDHHFSRRNLGGLADHNFGGWGFPEKSNPSFFNHHRK